MKYLVLSMSLLAIAGSATAQWKNMFFPNPVAFGTHDTTLFASEKGGGVYRLDPNRIEIESDNGIKVGPVITFASIGSYVLAGVPGGAYRSSNNGSKWEATNANALTCLLTNGSLIFAGSASGESYSTDSGMNWSPLSKSPHGVTTLVFVGTTLCAGTNIGIFRSTDSGKSWTPTGMKTASSALAVVGTIIFAATDGLGVFRSSDNGTNWTAADAGLFIPNISHLVSKGRYLFAGTGSGVFLSSDSGRNWDTVNYGLPLGSFHGNDDYLTVNALGVFDTLVFVGVWDGVKVNNRTYVRSIPEIIRSKDTTKSVVRVASVSRIDTLEIYPNPASGLVTIRGSYSIARVTVLNVLGEAVLTVPNNRETELTLDLSHFPSGTYFLRIETGHGTVMRKVVRE